MDSSRWCCSALSQEPFRRLPLRVLPDVRRYLRCMADFYSGVTVRVSACVVAVAFAVAGCSQDPPVADDPVPAQTGAPDGGTADVPAASDDPQAELDLTVPVRLTEVAQMAAPIAGAVHPNGALFIAERGGRVHVFATGSTDLVLDIADVTSTGSERGLLGVAFSADGDVFYVSYTDLAGDSVLAAYDVRDNQVVSETRRTVLRVSQPYGNHNGGDVQIGPDGFVYWALGDGGGGGDPLGSAQNVGTLLGTIIRIDPQSDMPYAVPADNPFVATPGALPEIFAYGLRNPWRFSFDRDTGDMWIADVGQSAREEVNRVASGASGMNFGWNLMEGTLPFAGSEPADHHPPVFEYDTSRQRCAITGGFVYRGTAIPELFGAYIFSDSCDGDLRAISVDDDGRVVDEANLGVNGGTVVSFVQDADGELYVLDLSGRVLRLEAQG